LSQAIIDGARCALHPEREAVGTCKRCGNFACSDCSAPVYDASTMCITCLKTAAVSRYHVVPLWRFVLFTLLTFGGYQVYWFWKNWSKVKRMDGSDIWPIPRALFAAFSYFPLITDINTQLAARGLGRALSSGLAVGFLLTTTLQRLPDPWWVVSLASFVFLIPAVNAIRDLASDAAIAEGAAWHARHTVVLLLMVPLCLLAAAGMLMGDEVPSPD
jgi:hypothetical protein